MVTIDLRAARINPPMPVYHRIRLEQLSFSSVRQLARLTHLLVATVDRWISQKLEFSAGQLRWMPPILTGDQQETCVNSTGPFRGPCATNKPVFGMTL
jgi:hypothetical protein